MATKKKSTDIVVDPDIAAVSKAIATGDTTGVSKEQIQAFLSQLGMKGVAAGVQEAAKYRRADTNRRASTAGFELSEDDVSAIEKLPQVIGKSPVILNYEDLRDLTQEEIDQWADEEITRRLITDIVGEKGRYVAERSTFINVAKFRGRTGCVACDGSDPDCETCEGLGFILDEKPSSTFASPKNGRKFTVTTQERTGEPNLSALEGVLDPKTWVSITQEVTTRVVDPIKVQEAFAEGKITLEQFAATVPESKLINVLRFDSLKEGDEV